MKKILFLSAFFLFGCNPYKSGKVEISVAKKSSKTFTGTITNISISNNQLIINGNNLDTVTSVKIEGGVNETLSIESKSIGQITANGIHSLNLDLGSLFNLILSNAEGAATFPISFSLCDAVLGGKSFNCTVVPNDKEVLSYDASTNKWKPRSVNGLSYQGAWDATTADPAAAVSGDYYIVSVAHGAYSIGDWIVFNGTTFDQISNSTLITNVFGRTGAVTATKGDYILTKMGDVDLVSVAPVNGNILKYNGTNWIPGSGTDATVLGFARLALPTCAAGEVLKSDGTNFSCVTAGAAAFSGTANRVVATNGSGALAVTAISDTILGYLSGVTSDIQTQISAKVASASFVDWSIAGLQTIEPTRINLTTASRAVATNAQGVPSASAVTSTELGYVSGVTSAIQTQLNTKLSAETDPNVIAFAKTALPTCAAGEVLKSDGTSFSCTTQWTKSSTDLSYTVGYVGIGTASPASVLDVSPTVSPAAAFYNQSIGGTMTPTVNIANAGSLKTSTSFSPPAGVTISNASGLRSIMKTGSTGGGVNNAYSMLAGAPSYGTVLPINMFGLKIENQGIAGITNNIGLYVATPSGATNNYAAIFQDGNVGIGTASPGVGISNTKLEVAADGSSVAALVRAYGTVNAGYRGAMARGTFVAPTATQLDDILVYLGGHGYGSTAFAATSKGTFVVKAAENWTDVAQGTYLTFETTPTGSTTKSERMRVDDAGNVGIGITPTALLTVNGTALATAWNTSSDKRLKENIYAIKNPLDKILSIRGVEFDWREDIELPTKHEATHDIGVIAQEVEKNFPEAVTNQKSGYKSVAYSKLIAPVIEAMREVRDWLVRSDKKIEINSREIASLKQENAELRKDIEELKKEIKKKK